MSGIAKRVALGSVVLLLAALAMALGVLHWRHAAGRDAATAEWQAAPAARLANVGTTRSLSILPLVDWFVDGSGLQGEPGVAWLIRTDQATILFDVGVNLDQRDPSPLLANMQRLGVALADIDTLVISHDHMDHVGGLRFARASSFSLSARPADLVGKRVFVPRPMKHPGVAPVVSAAPTVIARGVATTGTIAAQLYIGRVDEQALAIRVEGKGLVLVVGCGHQGLPRLLARAAQLFGDDEPLYAIIGGLHYPVPHGRMTTAGIDLQRLVAFGPFRAPTMADVQRDIATLAARRPAWVSLSAHDSSDEAIDAFRREFGPRYHELRVGQWQAIAGARDGL